MMNIVVTGGTGFLGQPICAELARQGHRVTNLTRNPDQAAAILPNSVNNVLWGTDSGDAWSATVASADAIIHLAGESVGGQRWTHEFKARILNSRVESTQRLVQAMKAGDRSPSAFISASAVGYYGDTGDAVVTEEAPAGRDFLASVCERWEGEARKAEAVGCRVVFMRTGIVLGGGGALQRMLYPLPVPISPWKLGLGGPLGSGKQWMPWIHHEDAVRMFLLAISDSNVVGPVNVTSPGVVRNLEFSHALGRHLHRPAVTPIPAFALKALLGEFADSLLGGQRAVPAVAQKLGFSFRYPEIGATLKSVMEA